MIVLDTHALIWWVSDPDRLPRKAQRLLRSPTSSAEPLSVSSISIWEIAMLVRGGRLQLALDLAVWLGHVEALPFLSFVPVDNQIALRAVQLEDFPHRDPADRMIVATAIGLGATLVTADSKLRGYSRVKCVWD